MLSSVRVMGKVHAAMAQKYYMKKGGRRRCCAFALKIYISHSLWATFMGLNVKVDGMRKYNKQKRWGMEMQIRAKPTWTWAVSCPPASKEFNLQIYLRSHLSTLLFHVVSVDKTSREEKIFTFFIFFYSFHPFLSLSRWSCCWTSESSSRWTKSLSLFPLPRLSRC